MTLLGNAAAVGVWVCLVWALLWGLKEEAR